AVAAAAADVGIRAMVGPHLADFFPQAAGQLPVRQADSAALLDRARAFIDATDGNGSGRVRAGVSAVWTITCSDELLCGLAELAAERDIPVHVHTNVLDDEIELHARWFEGRTPIERLEDAGLLTERLTLMHAGVLDDRDIARIAASNATVNLNPLGNALFGSGVAYHNSARRLLEAGVPIVLGSDTPMEKLASPFELMIGALAINREAAGDDFAFTLEQALTAATNGGASLGRPGLLGRLTPGQLGDLVVIRPDEPFQIGPRHPVPTVVLNGHLGQVVYVVIDGRVVVDSEHTG
ncbi:MAG: amidohydrolase family protein, partial [Chloroflexales bacterium]|nr:amidohydrolase family protein [Chloroflexales bacterium]